MKIEEAIERLEAFIERHPGYPYSDLNPAIQLGIEALNYFKNDRLYCQKIAQQLLPGETAKEKEAK